MHALNHSDLAKGLPDEIQRWLSHQEGGQGRRDVESHRENREYNYLAFSEFEN